MAGEDYPKTAATPRKLAEHYAGWLLGEADSEYRTQINQQIHYLAGISPADTSGLPPRKR
jgi:hypothetical protein